MVYFDIYAVHMQMLDYQLGITVLGNWSPTPSANPCGMDLLEDGAPEENCFWWSSCSWENLGNLASDEVSGRGHNFSKGLDIVFVFSMQIESMSMCVSKVFDYYFYDGSHLLYLHNKYYYVIISTFNGIC